VKKIFFRFLSLLAANERSWRTHQRLLFCHWLNSAGQGWSLAELTRAGRTPRLVGSSSRRLGLGAKGRYQLTYYRTTSRTNIQLTENIAKKNLQRERDGKRRT
jgi:hypothetical protein